MILNSRPEVTSRHSLEIPRGSGTNTLLKSTAMLYDVTHYTLMNGGNEIRKSDIKFKLATLFPSNALILR